MRHKILTSVSSGELILIIPSLLQTGDTCYPGVTLSGDKASIRIQAMMCYADLIFVE